VVKDDIFALSPAGSERYNLVPAEANATTQQSEKREIKGKVLDEQGKPIGGVIVLIKNKPFGAATDSEGNFGGLKVTNGDYLDISHVGYERQEVANEDGTTEVKFKETARYMLCPEQEAYGMQIPAGVWHTVNVIEPSVIFEAKDGAYVPAK
jgi:hypothetical protein